MQTITPFLWFDGKAEEAMNFYLSVFKHGKVHSVTPGRNGTMMSATFELDGQKFMALNAGPMFDFTPAISFFVNCETQEEVDELWEKSILGKLLQSGDAGKSTRVMAALMQMDKLDIEQLSLA
jgi:predicted 3-demethylubiquinone-9 3-methyltransferase (glyoxalase superfamily)